MDDANEESGKALEPQPTWGSTENVASGISSTSYNSQPTQVQLNRVLQMEASPRSIRSRVDQYRLTGELSSPVEEFSSPVKPTQISDHDSISSQAPIGARVGTWEITEKPDSIPVELEIDPNGDDELIRAQVNNIVAEEREGRRKRRREEQAISSSLPSQANPHLEEMMRNRIPQSSTPPPALKRPRRGQQIHEQAQANYSETQNAPIAPKIQDIDDNLTDLPSPATILADSTSEISRNAIIQYVKATPLIPNFLKDEIQRCILKAGQSTQSQESNSDSDTQEDGYLKTKPFWLFELMRIEVDRSIVAGEKMTSEVNRGSMTMILQVFPHDYTYEIRLIERESLIMSRNEARSNPWFDGNGHPFNIIYNSSRSNGSYSNDRSISFRTQPSEEELSQLQSRLSKVLEEKQNALKAKGEADKKLEAMLQSYQSTQEDNDFLRRQYDDASTRAVELARTNDELASEVAQLKTKLSNGIDSVKNFSESRINLLKDQLKMTQMQLDLLVQQNRLTNDAIREKAGKWDAYQAKEKIRMDEMERRRAEVDPIRAASYQAIQEEEARIALELRKLPHELFLEVDLDDQKKQEIPELQIEEGEEDDEIALLRAKAEAATNQAIDVSTPRSRRARSSRNASADVASTIPTAVQNPTFDTDIVEEQSIQQSQMQALNEAAQFLQGELEYQTQDRG